MYSVHGIKLILLGISINLDYNFKKKYFPYEKGQKSNPSLLYMGEILCLLSHIVVHLRNRKEYFILPLGKA